MALKEIIINTRNKINPLKHWNNAVWLYNWVVAEPDTAHCVLLAFIPIVARDVPLAKPDGFKWVKLDEQFISVLTSIPELGRILQMAYLTEDSLRKIVGSAIFSKDSSPPLSFTKRIECKVSSMQKESQTLQNDLTASHSSLIEHPQLRVGDLWGKEEEGVQNFHGESEPTTDGDFDSRAPLQFRRLYETHSSLGFQRRGFPLE